MNPKKFLYRLGIKNRSHGQSEDSSALDNALPVSNGDLKFDAMSPSAIDALFTSEELARETLGGNFKRLENSMRRLSKSPVFRGGSLDQVSELGGGTGVLGMWLADCRLCRHCEIYDHAANPLSIGKEWAKKLDLSTVSFHQSSYADIASAQRARNCDFVFAEHAIELSNYPDIWDENDHDARECHAFFGRRYYELAAAVSALLKPGAVALIGHGIAAPWALELLCNALRSQDLVINWSLTNNGNGFQLYIREGGDLILNSAREEALALVCEMMDMRLLPQPEISSQEEIFGDGNLYLQLRFQAGDEKGEILVKQKAGLAFFLERGSDGHESARLASAGHIACLVEEGLAVVNRTKNCVITHNLWTHGSRVLSGQNLLRRPVTNPSPLPMQPFFELIRILYPAQRAA